MRRSTKSFSFLLEFIIVLFFFACSSAICVKIQGQAQQTNQKARDTTVAIEIIQNYLALDMQGATSYDQNGQESSEGYFTIQQKQVDDIVEVSILHDEDVLMTLPYYKGGQTHES